MPVLYEVIELANGDVALQREGDNKGQPLVTMRFSTELLRFLRNGKLDVAKIMIEAGLEEVAKLAADFTEVDQSAKGASKKSKRGRIEDESVASTMDQRLAAQGSETQNQGTQRLEKKLAERDDDSVSSATKKLRRLKSVSTPRKEKISMKNRGSNSMEEELAEIEAVSHLIH